MRLDTHPLLPPPTSLTPALHAPSKPLHPLSLMPAHTHARSLSLSLSAVLAWRAEAAVDQPDPFSSDWLFQYDVEEEEEKEDDTDLDVFGGRQFCRNRE